MTRLRALFLLLCTLAWPSYVCSQASLTDSLELAASNADGNARIDILNQLMKMYLCRANEKAFDYNQQLLATEGLKDYAEGNIMRLKSLGTALYCASQVDSAIIHFQTALDLASKNHFEELAGALWNNLATMHRIKGELAKAKEQYGNCIKTGKRLQDTTLMVAGYNGLGVIYSDEGHLDSALHSFLSIEGLVEKTDNIELLVSTKINISKVYLYHYPERLSKDYLLGILRISEEHHYLKGQIEVYQHLSRYEFDRKNYEEAIRYAEKGLEVNKEVGNPNLQLFLLQSLGSIYHYQALYEKAIEVNKEAVALAVQTKQGLGLALLYSNLASDHVELKRYAQAVDYAQKATELIEANQQNDISHTAFLYLSKGYEGLGQTQKAFDAFKAYERRKALFLESEKSKQLTEMETKYETAKKEAENVALTQQNTLQAAELERKNLLLLVGGLVALLVVGAGYFWYVQRETNAKSAMIALEQRFLRSQLNPHFIFNALSSIQHYLLKNEAKKAGFYLAKFGKLMRQILENSRQEFISIEEEIKMLTNYMDLQNAKSENAFTYEVEVDEQLDPEMHHIPPMFTQPFVENAIEHGIAGLGQGGKVSVSFKQHGEFIRIQVLDNGKGLQQASSVAGKTHQSLSTVIIQERIAGFNKSLKKKIQLSIQSLGNGESAATGTKVELKVPYKLA